MARRPLKKSEQGKTECVKIAGGGANELCVTGRKYGFTAHLKSTRPEGGVLPVPTGKARTMKTAIRNARSFIRRVRAKRR